MESKRLAPALRRGHLNRHVQLRNGAFPLLKYPVARSSSVLEFLRAARVPAVRETVLTSRTGIRKFTQRGSATDRLVPAGRGTASPTLPAQKSKRPLLGSGGLGRPPTSRLRLPGLRAPGRSELPLRQQPEHRPHPSRPLPAFGGRAESLKLAGRRPRPVPLVGSVVGPFLSRERRPRASGSRSCGDNAGSAVAAPDRALDSPRS